MTSQGWLQGFKTQSLKKQNTTSVLLQSWVNSSEFTVWLTQLTGKILWDVPFVTCVCELDENLARDSHHLVNIHIEQTNLPFLNFS